MLNDINMIGKYSISDGYIVRVTGSIGELINVRDGLSAFLNNDALLLLKHILGILPDKEERDLQSLLLIDSNNRKALDIVSDLLSRGILNPENSSRVFKNIFLDVSTAIFLRTLHIHHTSRCNLDCFFCYSNYKKDLPFSLWKEIITNALDKMGTYALAFSGGEPLLDKRLLDFLSKMSKDYLFSTNFFSNAVYITGDMISRLRELHNVVFCISLHAASQDVFERISKSRISVGQILKNIELIKSFGYKVRIGTVFARGINDNPYEVEKIFNTVKALNPDSYAISNVTPMGKVKDQDKIRVPLSGYREILKDYIEGFLLNDKGYSIDPSLSHKCLVGAGMCNIYSDGTVTPCVSMQRFRLGNISDDSIVDLWENKIAKLYNIRSRFYSKCQDCELLQYCKSGCRGRALSYTGSIVGCDPEGKLAGEIIREIYK